MSIEQCSMLKVDESEVFPLVQVTIVDPDNPGVTEEVFERGSHVFTGCSKIAGGIFQSQDDAIEFLISYDLPQNPVMLIASKSENVYPFNPIVEQRLSKMRHTVILFNRDKAESLVTNPEPPKPAA